MDREYYRVTDLAVRWGRTVDDIVHLGVQDRVQICASFLGARIELTRILHPAPTESRAHDSDDEREQNKKSNEQLLSWLDRCSRRMPDCIMEIQHDDLLALEQAKGGPVMVEAASQYKTRWEQIEFKSPVQIDVSDLLILADEVEWVGGRFIEVRESGGDAGGDSSSGHVLAEVKTPKNFASFTERDKYVHDRWRELNASGFRNPTERVSKELNLSVVRIRQILQKFKKTTDIEEDKKNVMRRPAGPFDGL